MWSNLIPLSAPSPQWGGGPAARAELVVVVLGIIGLGLVVALSCPGEKPWRLCWNPLRHSLHVWWLWVTAQSHKESGCTRFAWLCSLTCRWLWAGELGGCMHGWPHAGEWNGPWLPGDLGIGLLLGSAGRDCCPQFCSQLHSVRHTGTVSAIHTLVDSYCHCLLLFC